MKISILFLILVIPLFSIISCDNIFNSDWHSFHGRVVYLDLEGGFFAINTDKGETLEPINLDERFKKDGLRIKGGYKIRKDLASIHMVGAIVELEDIKKEQ